MKQAILLVPWHKAMHSASVQSKTINTTLEVERKFLSLAVQPDALTNSTHGGTPAFRNISFLGLDQFRDVYYDGRNSGSPGSGILTSSGVWLRQRNGIWEAKIKKGGNFTNSMFEELEGREAVSDRLRPLLAKFRATQKNDDEDAGNGDDEANKGAGRDVLNDKLLEPIAHFSSFRMTWLVDDDFRIVLDSTNFGHKVGEVELKQIAQWEDKGDDLTCMAEGNRKLLQDMDKQIVDFMKRYAWAFTPGQPKGKLMAYFEWKARQDSSNKNGSAK